MSYLAEFLRGRIHREWWVYKVVDWYCEKRGFAFLPKGRCHFGEIFLFYAPAYIALGLLFKVILAGLRVIRFVLTPVWLPIRWFARRVAEDAKTSPGRPTVLFLLGLFAALAILIPAAVISGVRAQWVEEEVKVVFLATTFASALTAFLLTFVGTYLVIWTAPVLQPVFSSVISFGQEAAQRISLPRLARPTVLTVKVVGKAPFKVTVVGARHGGTLLKTLWTIARSTWRQRICPRIEYVDQK